MDEELEKTNTETEVTEPIVPEKTGDEAETTSEVQEEAATPNGELIEYINKFAPGSDTSTPEALLSAATKVIQGMAPIYDKLYDLAKASPESAAALNDWIETGDVGKALVRNYDPEEIKALIEELESDSYEEDRTMFAEKVKAHTAYQDKMAMNMAASQMGAQEFVDEVGATDKEIEEFKPFVDTFFADVEDRNLSKKHWLTLWKGFKHESDVTEAEENGKIIGRNEQIVSQKRTSEEVKNLLPEAKSAEVNPANQKQESSFLKSLRQKTEEKPVLS